MITFSRFILHKIFRNSLFLLLKSIKLSKAVNNLEMSWVDYKKVSKIGEGSYGKAWLVQDIKLDRLFVIKEVKISRVSIK